MKKLLLWLLLTASLMTASLSKAKDKTAADPKISKSELETILRESIVEGMCGDTEAPKLFKSCFKLDTTSCKKKALDIGKRGFSAYDPKPKDKPQRVDSVSPYQSLDDLLQLAPANLKLSETGPWIRAALLSWQRALTLSVKSKGQSEPRCQQFAENLIKAPYLHNDETTTAVRKDLDRACKIHKEVKASPKYGKLRQSEKNAKVFGQSYDKALTPEGRRAFRALKICVNCDIGESLQLLAADYQINDWQCR